MRTSVTGEEEKLNAAMLERLTSLLQPKVKRVFGFRLAKELDVCAKEIMRVFEVSDFHQDSEDTWEWFEGENKKRLKVNISRPHNWKTGDYEIPVIVRVSGPISRLGEKLFLKCVQETANRLCTETWTGVPIFPKKDDRHYTFEIETKFIPEISKS